MEITKKNFMEMLPSVKEAIFDCDFLAIDTELTGLSTQVTEHAFDTVSERYTKLKENCMKFIIIQFGLSTFKYHPKENKYTHQDYNFYVFPRPHIRQAPDPKFMCQTSSLHFLASQNFDFNKVIYEGIQYLSPAQEEKIKSFLANKHKNEQDALKVSQENPKANGQKEIDVPPEHKQFIEDMHERVDSFICNDEETKIILPPCSAYQRKLIYDTVQQKHQTGIEMASIMNEDNERVISIIKTTDEEKIERLQVKQINDLDELDAAVGFRKVIDYISLSKKLVIGHNMLLDVMHTLDQFFFSLPEQLEEFKQMLNMNFPKIVDTKVLASSEKLSNLFESTQLSKVFKQVTEKDFNAPVVELASGSEGYSFDTNKYHEAGYDAFVSGYCFLGLVYKLGSIQNYQIRNLEHIFKLITPYLNRVFIMRHYDIHCLNICGFDPEPVRENVFYVSFPQEWKTIDLVELFVPYGSIYVNWLDDVSALVSLHNKDNVINVKTHLLNKPSKLYSVRSFSEYQKAMKKGDSKDAKKSPAAANSETTRKRRASGSAETLELIPEADETEAEKPDDLVSTSHESKTMKSKAAGSGTPSTKRQKRTQEENDSEVTSTAPVFEEDNTW